MLTFFSRFLNKTIPKNSAIIGTEYKEYLAFKQLQKKNIKVLFFISDDPWKHNTYIEKTQIKYPTELQAICQKYNIRNVYYCDDVWLEKMTTYSDQINFVKIDDV